MLLLLLLMMMLMMMTMAIITRYAFWMTAHYDCAYETLIDAGLA